MKKLTSEHKAKISLSMRGGNSTSFKKGQTAWNKGKKFSEESRKKMSASRKQFYKNGGKHPLLGKKRPDMVGENNHNWNKKGKKHPKWTEDKKRPFYKAIREIHKYSEWRVLIFKRDKYTCTLCGISGVYLEVDHYPKRFIDIIRDNNVENVDSAFLCKELWDINNGRTLCKPCHLKTDTWGRRKQ